MLKTACPSPARHSAVKCSRLSTDMAAPCSPVEIARAVDTACRSRGGAYATYSCKSVSWDDVQRGTVGGGLSCWGGNITVRHVRRARSLCLTRPPPGHAPVGQGRQLAVHRAQRQLVRRRVLSRRVLAGSGCKRFGNGGTRVLGGSPAQHRASPRTRTAQRCQAALRVAYKKAER